MRSTVANLQSRLLPSSLGVCASDIAQICTLANDATQRLLSCGGEAGWWGSWSKVVFNVPRSDPYITLPAAFARMIRMDTCRSPVRIQNEWYEFLEAGIGLQQPEDCTANGCSWVGFGINETYVRPNVTTAYELTATNQKIRIYYTDARDIGKTVVFSNALDQNGNGIYTDDGDVSVNGFTLTLASPFVTTSYIVTQFGGIQKEETYGDIIVMQVDATSGVESLLSRYTPDETNPSYRRYYINQVPANCCNGTTEGTAQITAMCKHEFVPVARPTDFLLIGNIPALKCEMEAVRYESMDGVQDQQMALIKHTKAVKLLSEELVHYTGQKFSTNFAPFGTATLNRQAIGSLT